MRLEQELPASYYLQQMLQIGSGPVFFLATEARSHVTVVVTSWSYGLSLVGDLRWHNIWGKA